MMNKEGKFIEICILHLQIIFIQLILAFLQAPFKAPLLLLALLLPTFLLALAIAVAVADARLIPKGSYLSTNHLFQNPHNPVGGSCAREDDIRVGVVVLPSGPLLYQVA